MPRESTLGGRDLAKVPWIDDESIEAMRFVYIAWDSRPANVQSAGVSARLLSQGYPRIFS